MRRRKWLMFFVMIAVLLCVAGVLFTENRVHVLRELYDNIIMDNRNITASCTQWPGAEEVDRVIAAHQDTVQAIESVNPGNVTVLVDSMSCPGRAALWIQYPTHDNRVAIERIIDGDLFFGIPYRLQNY